MAAAEPDPDNPPLTKERLDRMNLRPLREVMAERRVKVRLDPEIVAGPRLSNPAERGA